MHHDSRVYIECRYDGDSMDVVLVHFRDRGILPIEVKTREYTLESPTLLEELDEELKSVAHVLWLELHSDL